VQRRFQIEDLIIQDASGIVFRALDTETGRPVALRRFFPFGANGGGLLQEEQSAYNIALNRLSAINHPALRAVISGGCDPVDGIPFIATEWIEGDLLDSILQRGPLSAEVAVELLTQALEVCELISHVLAEEAVWIETDPLTIVLGNAESRRGFTFWICPLKWLGGDEQTRGLQSIIELTEQVMGWQGMTVNDQAGSGLGAWLNWLRGAERTHLREVRENLAAATGKEPPPAAGNLVRQATRPEKKRKSSKIAVCTGLGLTLVLTGLSGWLLTRKPAAQAMPGEEAPASRLSEVTRRAQELSENASRERLAQEKRLAGQYKALEQQGGVYSIAQADLLAMQHGKSVELRGQLVKIEASGSGATLYLYFSHQPSALEPRGAVVLTKASGFSRAELESFIGREVSLTGKVALQRKRPEVSLTRRADIKVIE
jgi:hypothetical protein